jgi:hypothetical protein
MPDYAEILEFLAANPPHIEAERELHASLLELLAKCLRAQQVAVGEDGDEEDLEDREIHWVSVN